MDQQITQVQLNRENFFKISHVDQLRPFFMSIVSDANHWMFIGSNGGLSAGRKDAENAIFPYYTDDKIIESYENTGSKSIFQIQKNGKQYIWEPFTVRNAGKFAIERNLYKNIYGNKVVYEEVNLDLDITFRFQWCTSKTFGFIKQSTLINRGSEAIKVSLLDGIQNIMPYGVGSMLQGIRSNLVDAYKRNELDAHSGIGIYALSAIIVDKAEPSEALKANIAWSVGLKNPKYLISSIQLDNFRAGHPIVQEEDIKAERGAYFVNDILEIAPGQDAQWMIIADVNKGVSDIIKIGHDIAHEKNIQQQIIEEIEAGTKRLIQLTASADGLQFTDDKLRDTRHFSNTLFNIMRGGIFDDHYNIEKNDFLKYLRQANIHVFNETSALFNTLDDKFSLFDFKSLITKSSDSSFQRLCLEYLPLKFSRRHGDPSRPWNQFSINTHNENDGSKILDYEGNWRDIFQNWEALALSYPAFIEGMIFKFLNASTFDGYNPYRVTKNGIDWEKIEADDPWSYIGYWGDHQIIYLLKFLEIAEHHFPGRLNSYFDNKIFVYANVPYKIKSYQGLLKNAKDTIDFDHDLDHKIEAKRAKLGADGVLLTNSAGEIQKVNFIEKILATVLAKMSNFIPEAGIWMNTQRPEWNDANNALVGNGVSMVTLYYLRRFLAFMKKLLGNTSEGEFEISSELLAYFNGAFTALKESKSLLNGPINNAERKKVLDGLGMAGSHYRLSIYDKSFSGQYHKISANDLLQFIDLSLDYLEHSIKANKRADNLYHAYNLMTVENEEEISISYTSEMLEGQVAVLSSGYLTATESQNVLDALKSSSLFRKDQYSYILYPDKQLPGFLSKNNIPDSAISQSKLLTELANDGNQQIVLKDVNGGYHFNGNLKNANDLIKVLDAMQATKYAHLIEAEKKQVLLTYEQVFNHKAFTGRSGTFFGYEGLGSIYWHMVSKLLLAVQESCLHAIQNKANDIVVGKLLEHYYEINAGIGVHKSPSLYGAFPTDPYSHTPAGKGAQQPGMTGQVKEDILSRFGELGVFVNNGKIMFNPCMLRKSEFLSNKDDFRFVNLSNEWQTLSLGAGSLAFTYCQIPIVYQLGEKNELKINHSDGSMTSIENFELDQQLSESIFKRSGWVNQITVLMTGSMLK